MGHTVLDTVEDIKKTLLLLGSSHGFHFTGRPSTVTPARTAADEISKFPDGIMHQLVVPLALAGVQVDSVNTIVQDGYSAYRSEKPELFSRLQFRVVERTLPQPV